MTPATYSPTKPIYCGRLSGQLASSLCAGDLALIDLEAAIYGAIIEDEAEVTTEDIEWIARRATESLVVEHSDTLWAVHDAIESLTQEGKSE